VLRFSVVQHVVRGNSTTCCVKIEQRDSLERPRRPNERTVADDVRRVIVSSLGIIVRRSVDALNEHDLGRERMIVFGRFDPRQEHVECSQGMIS
jgi:hypothetical protein